MKQPQNSKPPIQQAALDKINRDMALQFMKASIAELKQQQQKTNNIQTSNNETNKQ